MKQFQIIALAVLLVGAMTVPAAGQRRIERKSGHLQATTLHGTVLVNAPAVVRPGESPTILIMTVDEPVVGVSIYPVDRRSWMRKTADRISRPNPIGPCTWHTNLDIPLPHPKDSGSSFISKRKLKPALSAGLYLISATGGDVEAWTVINVTNLSVVVKRSPKRALVWVTDSTSGAVVPAARIELVNSNGTSTSTGATGADGACLLDCSSGERALVVTKGSDISGTDTDVDNPDGQLKCLIQTDRIAYRPGQTVYFKAIARLTDGQGYKPLANRDFKIQLCAMSDEPIDQILARSNDLGDVEGSFRISPQARLGGYFIRLNFGKQSEEQLVEVLEYRKPEYRVDVDADGKRYFSGQDIRFRINAKYFFGAPVGQAPIQWAVNRRERPYDLDNRQEDWEVGAFRNPNEDDYGYGQPVATGTTTTDNSGHSEVVFHIPEGTPDSTYTFSATVEDLSNRAEFGVGQVLTYAASLRVGLDVRARQAMIGTMIPVEVHLTDLEKQPIDGRVEVDLIEHLEAKPSGIIKDKLVARAFATTRNGSAILDLPALAYGRLDLVAIAKDRTGRKTQALDSVSVIGENPAKKSIADWQRLNVTLDKDTYRPGDSIHVLVQGVGITHPVLLTETGSEIWDYRVVNLGSKPMAWIVSADIKHSPCVFVTASSWINHHLAEGWGRQAAIPDRSRVVKVEVASEQTEVRPGGEATLHVRTTDVAGNPIPSEFGLTVADEALYLTSGADNPNPFGFFWAAGPDKVASFNSERDSRSTTYGNAGASGPMYSMSAPRQDLKDTAYWNAFVRTGRDGTGMVRFQLPDNLTSWRATGIAVAGGTKVGWGRTNLIATRPVTIRLATPRVVSQGDRLTLQGIVNNRTSKSLTVDVDLQADGVKASDLATRRLVVPADSAASTTWSLNVESVPVSGSMSLTARAIAEGEPETDFSDALKIDVPVVPRGVPELSLVGGTAAKTAETTLRLPGDALSQGSELIVSLHGGLRAIVTTAANRVLSSDRYGTMWAVDALKAAVASGLNPDGDEVKDAMALLRLNWTEQCWGLWAGTPPTARITAEAAYAFAIATKRGFPISEWQRRCAIGSCNLLYGKTNLWEDRALLAASLFLYGADSGPKRIADVLAHGLRLSPFAKLRLAEVLSTSNRPAALKLLSEVLPFVSEGPESSILPVGDEFGWSATSTQSAAELLIVLHKLGLNPDLQSRIAKRLAVPDSLGYRSTDDDADVVSALALYAVSRPDAKAIGDAVVIVNGHTYKLEHSTVSESATVVIRDSVLSPGSNTIRISRSGDGEAFYTVQTQVYRPLLNESIRGVRVSRRFESQNGAGIWKEISGPIKIGSEVRCTVLVWGDDVPDAIRVTEPVPAGFEFIRAEDGNSDFNEEQRDGRVIHYFQNTGTPVVLQYYLRAETDGSLVALPAVAEYLRRPAVQGHSAANPIVVNP